MVLFHLHYESSSCWAEACDKEAGLNRRSFCCLPLLQKFEAELYGTQSIIQSDCLLTRHADKKSELLSALMLWQFDGQQQDFSVKKVAQRSDLALEQYL